MRGDLRIYIYVLLLLKTQQKVIFILTLWSSPVHRPYFAEGMGKRRESGGSGEVWGDWPFSPAFRHFRLFPEVMPFAILPSPSGIHH